MYRHHHGQKETQFRKHKMPTRDESTEPQKRNPCKITVIIEVFPYHSSGPDEIIQDTFVFLNQNNANSFDYNVIKQFCFTFIKTNSKVCC